MQVKLTAAKYRTPRQGRSGLSELLFGRASFLRPKRASSDGPVASVSSSACLFCAVTHTSTGAQKIKDQLNTVNQAEQL